MLKSTYGRGHLSAHVVSSLLLNLSIFCFQAIYQQECFEGGEFLSSLIKESPEKLFSFTNMRRFCPFRSGKLSEYVPKNYVFYLSLLNTQGELLSLTLSLLHLTKTDKPFLKMIND